MEDEPSGEGSALILGRPFLRTARTKIDVHVGTLSMEFGDTFVKFNIFEALKHHAKDHFIFNIDAIEGLIEEYFRIGISSANLVNFVDISNDFIYDLIHYRIDEVLGKSQYAKFPVVGTSKPRVKGETNLISVDSERPTRSSSTPRRKGKPRLTPTYRSRSRLTRSTPRESRPNSTANWKPNLTRAERSPSKQRPNRVGQPTPSIEEKDISPQPSNIELKPLPEHLKPKLRMSRPNQERSDPVGTSRLRRSSPGQTSLLGQSRLQWLKSLRQECRYDYAKIKESIMHI
ncbi:hypothetical protein CR513_30043, partial [Mucuna pruriens]